MALPNFPVPRELRDQIYGYLFDSAFARVIRPDNGLGDDDDEDGGRYTIQAYKFHTNILAVNRTIHDEAEEYLYKNNIFVVVSSEWPVFAIGSISNMCLAPLVNAKHVAKMQNHSLRLHWTPSSNVKTSTPGSRVGDKVPITSYLLLRDDFRAFCIIIQHHLNFMHGFAISIADDVSKSPAIAGIAGTDLHSNSPVKPASMKIQLRDTRFRAVDAVLQRDMLGILSSISCGSMRVTISGTACVGDTDHIRRVKDLMGPTLLSDHATMWANFEMLCEAKKFTDGMAQLGELKLAASSYDRIYIQILRILGDDANLQPQSLVTRRHLGALCFDVLSTLGYLDIRLRTLTGMVSRESHLRRRWAVFSSPRGFEFPIKAEQAHFKHLFLLFDLYLPDHIRGRETTRTVDAAMTLLASLGPEPHILHDLAILEKVPNKMELASRHLPIDECSASKLPLPYFFYHQSQQLCKKPDHFVGRQSLDSLRRLDSAAKKDVNLIQKYHGQKITIWQ